MQSSKDKALYCNTLIGIIKACEGKQVQIDLRNELQLYGTVDSVSSNMNITMSNVHLTMPFSALSSQSKEQQCMPRHYNEITLRGHNVRFVHIPDEIDMIDALQQQIMRTRSNFNPNVKENFKAEPKSKPKTKPLI